MSVWGTRSQAGAAEENTGGSGPVLVAGLSEGIVFIFKMTGGGKHSADPPFFFNF